MKKTNSKGFTIVELVIVIAVIAILAAVLIPTFSGIINRANESVAFQETKNTLTEVISQNGDCKAGTMFYHPSADKGKYTTFLYADGKLTELGVLTYGDAVTTAWESKDGITGVSIDTVNMKIVYNALIIGSYTVSGEATFANMSTGYGKSYVSASAQISMFSTSAYVNITYTDENNILTSESKVSNAPKNANLTLTAATGKTISAVTVKVNSTDVSGTLITNNGSSVTIDKSAFNSADIVTISITVTGTSN